MYRFHEALNRQEEYLDDFEDESENEYVSDFESEDESDKIKLAILSEDFPINDVQRIGIELEGIGSINVKWGEEQPNRRSSEFHDVFKATPLVRSGSYGKGRGVYIVPEDVSDKKDYGLRGPAELVSSPHTLDKKGLEELRASYKKAMVPDSKKNPMLQVQEARLQDPRLCNGDDTVSKYIAKTRWAQHILSKVGGSLQTTIGVEVSKLLSDDRSTRTKIVNMLIGDKDKRKQVRDLLFTAIIIERVLTDTGRPLNTYGDNVYGIRLSLFMYLLRIFSKAASASVWSKAAYGANFKGHSSLLGCGSNGAREHLTGQLVDMALETSLMQDIVTRIQQEGLDPWIINGLTGKNSVFSLSNIGKPGLSIQTSVENWLSIPNFIHEGVLYTVVESREKTSGLNIMMASFLNEELNARDFLQELKKVGLTKL